MTANGFGCPNFPPCGHDALMHRVNHDASGYECQATDRVPDDRQQRYIEAPCRCGTPKSPAATRR